MKKRAKTLVKSVLSLFAVMALLSFLFSLSTVKAETSGNSDQANLTISDQTDSGPRFSNNNFSFYANFTNSTYSPINVTYGNCNISFDFNGSQTKVDRMLYNFTFNRWDFNRSFNYKGVHQFYVNCTSTFGNITLNESFEISNTAPTVSKDGGGVFVDTDDNDFSDDYWICTEDILCTYNFTANVTDPDVNDVLSYANLTANTTLTNFTFNQITGILNVNASENSLNGVKQIRLQASDGLGQDDGILRLNISSTNDAPKWIDLENKSFNESSLFEYIINATDEENNIPFNITIQFLNCTVAEWSTRNCSNVTGLTLFNTSQRIINENGSINISFTPIRNDVGDYVINFTVKDLNNNNTPYNASTSKVVNFTVNVINSIPYFGYVCNNEKNATEGGEFTCRINATDVDETKNLTFSANYSWFYFNDTTANITQMTVNSTTNFNASVLVNFTAQDAQVGNWSINITVSDRGIPVGRNSTTMYVLIRNVNDSVTIDTMANVTQYTSNGQQTILANATDNDLLVPDETIFNEILTFNTNDSDVTVTFSEITGTNKTRATLTYNPSAMNAGNHTINVSVHDFNNFSIAWTLFTIQIISNSAPVWNSSIKTNWTIYEGNLTYYDLSLNVSDSDGTQINFSWINDTSFQSFSVNKTTGRINFTAIDQDVGHHIVNVTATDGATNTSLLFNFTIYNINDNVSISRPLSSSGAITVNALNSNMNMSEDSTATIIVYVDDDDFKIPAGQKKGFGNESISLNLTVQGPNITLLNFVKQSGLPNDANPNRTQFNAAFTTSKEDVGSYNITINASDISNSSDIISFNLTIIDVQHPPNMTLIGNLTFSILETINIDINATDLEDKNETATFSNLTYKIVNLTDKGNFLTINKTTGLINFGFNQTYAGVWNFNVSVNDSSGLYDWEIFNITVYDYPVILSPAKNVVFNFKENFTTQLNFSVNHTVLNNLTYQLIINGQVSNTTSGNGNATDFLWNYTTNFTQETTCSGMVNLTLNVSNEKLSNLTFWNLTVNHTNYPLILTANITDQSSSGSVTLTLSSYFLDIDAGSGSCTNQTIGFNYSLINSTGAAITVEIVNWTNSTPTAAFTAASVASANYTITGIEYNSTDYALPINSTVKSNQFTISITAASTNTTTSPSSGGGGGGDSDEEKIVSLKILVPEPVSAKKKDKLILPIGVWNDGSKNLNEIILDAVVAKNGILRTDLIATFDRSFIPFLASGDRTNVTLIIDIDTQATGIFEITINATVKDPVYTDWAKFYIEIKEDETVLEKIVFTEEFIVGNPECAELYELINEAKNLYIVGDFVAATRKADDALDACKRAISQPARQKAGDLLGQKLLTYTSIASLVAFALGFAYYYYKRVKLRRTLKGY